MRKKNPKMKLFQTLKNHFILVPIGRFSQIWLSTSIGWLFDFVPGFFLILEIKKTSSSGFLKDFGNLKTFNSSSLIFWLLKIFKKTSDSHERTGNYQMV
jgi:hypothetical protein